MTTRSNSFAALVAAAALLAIGTACAEDGKDRTALTATQIEAARTPADHEAIARAYEDEAAALERKARSHESMAKVYRSGGAPKAHPPSMTAHCERLVSQYRAAAQEAHALAKEHHELAAQAGK